MKTIKDIILRIVAVFVIGALGTIGASSLFGVKPFVAASIAGVLATFDVIAELARFYVADGKLTETEINKAFSKATKTDGDKK
jgi:hypothetical protein